VSGQDRVGGGVGEHGGAEPATMLTVMFMAA
jgi:hypothetical protein